MNVLCDCVVIFIYTRVTGISVVYGTSYRLLDDVGTRVVLYYP